MIWPVSAQAEGPQLVVVTVTYNSLSHLPDFAQSLGRGMGDLRWHVVVADNASSDGTPEAAESMAWPQGGAATVVRTGGNLGYAGGINRALELVPPELPVLVVNPDVRFEEGAVVHLLEALGPDTGIAVPVQLDRDGRPLPTLRREPSVTRAWGEALLGGTRGGGHDRLGEMVTDPARYGEPTTADWATGSVMAISPACRGVVEPWDDRYFLYSEETDFALRARDRGFRLRLVPEARCRHLLGDSHVNPALWALLSVNRVRLFRRRHGALSTAAFRLALAAGSGLRAVTTRRATHRAAFLALVTPASRWPELGRRLSRGT
ncbi:MAG: glycosyltransferase family 2 protein [Micrococcales bacterium]|nr:glycosyltransferase family 2 protein [Micrococcales bacterium]